MIEVANGKTAWGCMFIAPCILLGSGTAGDRVWDRFAPQMMFDASANTLIYGRNGVSTRLTLQIGVFRCQMASSLMTASLRPLVRAGVPLAQTALERASSRG